MNKIVKQSMIGAHTHINVLQALLGLIHDQATERTIENSHSTYELVYHMIIWQTVFIKNIKDEPVDWKEADEIAWPTEEQIAGKTWQDLVQEFKNGFKEAELLLETVDLNEPMKTFWDAPVIKMYFVLNQHNSYHLGQIITNRMAQGTWPPKEKVD